MKNIFKFLWLFFELDYFFLSENEAIMKYCEQEPCFQKDGLGTRRKHHYTIVKDGSIKGCLTREKGSWFVVIGDDVITHKMKTITKVGQLRSIVKKYCK